MEDFEEEQQLVGSLVHLFVSADLPEQAAMYVAARKHFASPGPTLSMRIAYTLPPLVFASLKLALELKDQEDPAKKVFKFVHETISGLNRTNDAELTLKLFVNAALAASKCGLDVIAYEFVTQTFVVYEDSITDSKQQAACLGFIMGAIYEMQCFDKENYETLITKTAQHASRLLVKPAQCTAIYTVSHLFWTPQVGSNAFHPLSVTHLIGGTVSGGQESVRMPPKGIEDCRHLHGDRYQSVH
jgi:vacuolar protein sorting-associated protein 35